MLSPPPPQRGDISIPEYELVDSDQPPREAGVPKLNEIQRKSLSDLCSRYGVEFRETDYFTYPETLAMMAGWAEGWIGGNGESGRKLYVGCDPKTGQIHS